MGHDQYSDKHAVLCPLKIESKMNATNLSKFRIALQIVSRINQGPPASSSDPQHSDDSSRQALREWQVRKVEIEMDESVNAKVID
ncbi:MAG: hypothetical protein C5B55_00500 [Blastocatellia bacterium]|nr:MAG: hypothetical protein C5B55_00500 [Blastocatellia bacterium]